MVGQALVLGWRALGFRLRPRSRECVLGWPIAESAKDRVVLAAASPLFGARNIAIGGPGLLTWVTVVEFRGRLGRFVWTAAAPIHHVIIRRLLQRAAL